MLGALGCEKRHARVVGDERAPEAEADETGSRCPVSRACIGSLVCSVDEVSKIGTKERAMKKNMGTTDRVLRILVAAGAVAGSGVLGFTPAWAIVLLAVAAVMVVTSLSGYCPLYSLLRIETTGTAEVGTNGRHLSRLHRAA
jgi:hypothetical protein